MSPSDVTGRRALFLEAATTVCQLAADPAVAAAWERPSALAGMTVGALAGHLVANLRSLEDALASEEPPPGREISPSRYYGAVPADQDDAVHADLRAGAAAAATVGPAVVVADAIAATDRLRVSLPAEPTSRRLTVTSRTMLLDDYLVTRLVELHVHSDDLAVSVGIDSPVPDPAAATLMFDCFLGMARYRRGDLAVLRAFTRRERDEIDAVRVL